MDGFMQTHLHRIKLSAHRLRIEQRYDKNRTFIHPIFKFVEHIFIGVHPQYHQGALFNIKCGFILLPLSAIILWR